MSLNYQISLSTFRPWAIPVIRNIWKLSGIELGNSELKRSSVNMSY